MPLALSRQANELPQQWWSWTVPMIQERDCLSTKILAVEVEIGSRLNITRRARGVRWLDPNEGLEVSRSFLTKGLTSSFPSDQCYFENASLLLPSVLRERLTPHEFRPLIASTIIYEKKVLKWIALARTVLFSTLLLALSGIILLFSKMGPGGLALMVPLSVIVAFPILMLIPFCFRMGRLSADKRASSLVGTGDFLHTLEKIDSFRFSDIEELKRSRLARFRSSVPSITQRISVVRSTATMNLP